MLIRGRFPSLQATVRARFLKPILPDLAAFPPPEKRLFFASPIALPDLSPRSPRARSYDRHNIFGLPRHRSRHTTTPPSDPRGVVMCDPLKTAVGCRGLPWIMVRFSPQMSLPLECQGDTTQCSPSAGFPRTPPRLMQAHPQCSSSYPPKQQGLERDHLKRCRGAFGHK